MKLGTTMTAGVVALGIALAAPLSTQEATERSASYGWDGTPQDGPALLKEIAAARVTMEVEGDFAQASAKLAELSLRAAEARGFEGQAEALVQATLARAELEVRRGDLRQALEELRQILPARIVSSKLSFTSPSKALLQALASAETDARLAARRAELERKPQATRTGSGESLQRLVDEAFGLAAFHRIVEIGAPAFERFAERVLAEVDNFPASSNDDPLLALIRLDERRTARLLREKLDGSGYLWKKRVMRAMAAARVLDNEGTWTNTGPFVCLEPEWLELVVRLLCERDTAQEALPFFSAIEQRDALTNELNAAFKQALVTLGAEFATAAMQVFDHPGVVPSAQVVMEAALELPDARLRRFAAEKLVNFERSEALLEKCGDPDPDVRGQVLSALSYRQVKVFQAPNHPLLTGSFHPRIAGKDSATVRRLLADEDEDIRAGAVALLDRMEEAPDAAFYLKLAQDPAPKVRAALVSVERLTPERRAQLLESLARDSAGLVIEQVDSLLREASDVTDGPIGTAPGPYLPALELRWRSVERPLEGDLRWQLIGRLAQSIEGTRALVAWTLANPTPEALSSLAQGTQTENLFSLPDEFLARLLASGTWAQLWKALDADVKNRVERPAAMRLLLANPKAARLLRLSAARLAADDSPGFRAALVKFLQDASWKERAPEQDERHGLRTCCARFEPGQRNALALAVLRDAAITSEVADAFVAGYRPDAPGGRELTEAVLERWLRPGAPASAAVETALVGLGALPELARSGVLERALEVLEYSQAVIAAITDLADPAYLPLLRRAMKAEWLPVKDRVDLQGAAAGAFGSFDDDQAVELLLEGMRSNDDGVRAECDQSLARISAYRDQVKAWRVGSSGVPTKASALGELMAMLADKDPLVRKEAARGIAALGAVEGLPELIRRLKDADAGVREAAQKALDRLNAAPVPTTSGG